VPEISERVNWAILRGMSLDRSQRPATCREFVEDLTGQSTRKIAPQAKGDRADLWYMVYNDDQGIVHTARGSLEGIRRSVQRGRLGNIGAIRIGRSKTGPLAPLRYYPEFRDLAVCTAMPTPSACAATPAPATRATVAAAPRSVSPPARSIRAPAPNAESTSPRLPAHAAPFISVPNHAAGSDHFKWFVLFLVALASAAAGYYLLPLLRYLPL
jgi:hypothetical protein